MNKKSKKVRILISTTSNAQLSDSEVADIVFGSVFSELSPMGGESVAAPAVDDTGEVSLFDSDPAGSEYGGASDYSDDMNGGTVHVSVIGVISEQDGRLELCYDETELTDMSGSHTVIGFEKKGEVTLVRTGNAKTTLCFNDKRERRLCCYNDSFLPLEIAVITERFTNTLNFEKGGELDVTYSVELKGLPVESTRLVIKAKPI